MRNASIRLPSAWIAEARMARGWIAPARQSKECNVKRILFLSTILAIVAAAGRMIMGRRGGDEDEA